MLEAQVADVSEKLRASIGGPRAHLERRPRAARTNGFVPAVSLAPSVPFANDAPNWGTARARARAPRARRRHERPGGTRARECRVRWVVFGAGAVGGVVGARLHRSGHDVTLVARGDHLRALRARGLRVESPDGASTLRIPAVDDVAPLGLTPRDVVLIATKSQHTDAALQHLVPAVPPELPVLC